MKLVHTIASRPRSCLAVLLAAAYGGLLIYLQGLQFAPTWDEPDFWEASLQFSQRLIPTIDQLKNYGELNTPLPFVVFGVLEYLFRGGIFAGRLLNFVLSFTIVWLIGTSNPAQKVTALLTTLGLLTFPYYLLLSGYLYTDIIAAFFVFFGCWFYMGDRHGWSGVMFALAIASRQYMLAFPVAIALYEFLATLRQEGFKLKMRWVAPLRMDFAI
jgi:Gpi18-like mannosyltransferase